MCSQKQMPGPDPVGRAGALREHGGEAVALERRDAAGRRKSGGYGASASSSNVGIRSMKCRKRSSMPPAGSVPGQEAISGVEMPPSSTQRLYFRNGLLLAFAHSIAVALERVARAREERRGCCRPSSAARWPSGACSAAWSAGSSAQAPLSERNSTSVLSRMPELGPGWPAAARSPRPSGSPGRRRPPSALPASPCWPTSSQRTVPPCGRRQLPGRVDDPWRPGSGPSAGRAARPSPCA